MRSVQFFGASHGWLVQNFVLPKKWTSRSELDASDGRLRISPLVRWASAFSELRATLVAAAVFAIVYIALDLNKLYALRYGADLGTYLQTLVNLRHGSSWNYGEWKHHFAVHDSWVLTALVPFVALFPRAQTLVVVQVLAVACAAVPLVLLGRELGLSARGANILGVAYLLSPAAQGLTYDNFSENVFVPLLAICAALAARKRKFWWTLVFAQLLMGLKEDQILFVLWFGAACTIWWDRRIGFALCALAAVNGLGFWLFEHARAGHPNDPGYSLQIFNPTSKASMFFLLLAPFAFAPLAVGRWLLLGLPMAAEIVFMRPWNYEPSRLGSHYVASLFAATAIAAAFGFARYWTFARFAIPGALLVMVLFNDTVLRPGRWPYVVDWNAYARAVALRDSAPQRALLPRREEGVWAVAAANPGVELDSHPDPHFVACPAYDTNVRVFFESLAGRMPAHLCGGVPVAP
ncbi:MAG: DUF2079 domain-containing protein [Candidatus Eremiobacteraeota bacterium]|nr:DUF2079 domain-containing protein [Candidatus Eremiobacteraeota bacterium]